MCGNVGGILCGISCGGYCERYCRGYWRDSGDIKGDIFPDISRGGKCRFVLHVELAPIPAYHTKRRV